MFSSLGWPEIAVLLTVAMFVFGPDRLPGLAADAARTLRRVKNYARSVRDDLAEDMPELKSVDMRSMNPRTFLVRHVLTDEPAPRPRPVRPAVRAHALPEGSRRARAVPDEREPRVADVRDTGGSNGQSGND